MVNKMKKYFVLFFTMLSAIVAAIALTACGDKHEPPIDSTGGHTAHEFEFHQLLKTPTCTAAGSEEYICSECGYKETRPIDALGHDWDEWTIKKLETCTEPGEDIRTCKRDPSHVETCAYEPLDHDWRDWTVETPPTCTEPGVEVRTCKRTSFHKDYRTIDPLGHTDELQTWTVRNSATCYAPGTEVLRCDRCYIVLDSRRKEAFEHKYINGVCTRCGKHDWSTSPIDEPDLYHSEYGFKMLANETNGTAMQALYLLIDGDAKIYHSGTSDSSLLGEYDYPALGLTMDEAVAVWKTYLDDHPLYYWFNRSLSYSVEALIVTVDAAYTNHEVRTALNQMIYEKASAWREDTVDNEYLTALSYHDKIISEVDYLDSRIVYPEGTSWAHNIVGVFEGKGAVCEGYARSFQLLLNMTGIENVFVTGMSGKEAHAWNLVKLDDGQWYWFDLTNDDSPRWMWGIKYRYFAVSAKQNINWLEGWFHYSGYEEPEIYFSDNHTPASGTGINFLVQLPEVSKTPYRGTVRLRKTFSVGNLTYAVAGYRKVQLVKCNVSGDVHIPATVNHFGLTYDVVSVGDMNSDGFFLDIPTYSNMYTAPVDTLYIPSSVRFLWTSGVHNEDYGIKAFDVAEDNEVFASLDGVLFTKDLYTLISYPEKSPRTEYKIPDGVVFIAEKAFSYGTDNLRSLKIGKDVLEGGLNNMGYGWECSEKTGSFIVSIHTWGYALLGMSALDTITVDPENKAFHAENNLLFNKSKTILYAAPCNIEELIVPESVEEIQHFACWNRFELKKVIFTGKALKEIGGGAFGNCRNLREVIFNGTHNEWDAVKNDGLHFEDYNTVLTCLKD